MSVQWISNDLALFLNDFWQNPALRVFPAETRLTVCRRPASLRPAQRFLVPLLTRRLASNSLFIRFSSCAPVSACSQNYFLAFQKLLWNRFLNEGFLKALLDSKVFEFILFPRSASEESSAGVRVFGQEQVSLILFCRICLQLSAPQLCLRSLIIN